MKPTNTSAVSAQAYGRDRSTDALPIFLIVLNSITAVLYSKGIIRNEVLHNTIGLIGHPFSALIISTLLALYVLGVKRGFSKDQLMKLSNKLNVF